MPVNLIYGHIDQMEINCSVLKLNSEAVKVKVDTLNIVLQPQSKQDWENIETAFTDYKLKQGKAEEFAQSIFDQVIGDKDNLV